MKIMLTPSHGRRKMLFDFGYDDGVVFEIWAGGAGNDMESCFRGVAGFRGLKKK